MSGSVIVGIALDLAYSGVALGLEPNLPNGFCTGALDGLEGSMTGIVLNLY